MKKFFCIIFTIIFCSAFFDNKDNIAPEPKTEIIDKIQLVSDEFSVVTAKSEASIAGKYILSKGGNAIDAAIASQLVLNLVEPHASGIGGGGFLIYYDAKEKKNFFYDARETAPKLFHEKIFLNKDGTEKDFSEVANGGLTVGVPTILKLFKTIHKKHGKLNWFELFVPAIDLASQGFNPSPRLVELLNKSKYVDSFYSTKEYFFDSISDDKIVRNKIYNHPFAELLRDIAENGIDSFYEGDVAKNIVSTVQKSKVNPGLLTLDDLKNYKVKERDLICEKYRKYKICTVPRPSSGGVTILQTLGILENFDLPQMEYESVELVHIVSEALRLGYSDRNIYAADDDFVRVPVKEMLSKKYLKERSYLINIDSTLIDITPGEFGLNLANIQNKYDPLSTTQISIIDKYGNAVSFTSSIQYYFGSGLMTNGFLLNNQLTDFAFSDEFEGKKVANRPQSGKKPRSSMAPTIVYDENDQLLMVIGSPGGSRIISYIVKTLIAVLDFNYNINDAIKLPNYTKMSDVLELEEDTYLESFKSELEQKGHKLRIRDLTSGLHGIFVKENKLFSGVDPRREGKAEGF